MSQGPSIRDDFTWSGALVQSGGIRAVYERCQRLRFTGLLELRDGARRTEVTWLGGQPVELGGAQETQEVMLWQSGEFRAIQRIPTMEGALSGGTELSGGLGPGLVERLCSLCSEHKLTADLHLQQPSGAQAQVRFTHGKVESAMVEGQAHTGLQAISVLSFWVLGRYCVRLRPLFGAQAPAPAPIFVEKKTGRGDFDVTGAMLVPMEFQDAEPAPAGRSPAPASPLNGSSRRRLELAAELDPPAQVAARPAPPRPRPVWGPALAIGLVGGVAAFFLAGGVRMMMSQRNVRLPDLPATPPPAVTAPVVRAPAPSPPPAAAPAPRDPPAGEAMAGQRAEEPKVEQGETSPRDKELQAMVERARRIISEGRYKKALEVLGEAQKRAPEDAELVELEKQARGELGRGELVLTGTGNVNVNGYVVAAPKRLRMMAGPYVVDGQPLELKDGGRLEVQAK